MFPYQEQLNDLYTDCEEIVLAIMAAGVPANRIKVTHPELIFDQENKTYRISSDIFIN